MLHVARSTRNFTFTATRRTRSAIFSRYISEDAKQELVKKLLSHHPIAYNDVFTKKKSEQLDITLRGILPSIATFAPGTPTLLARSHTRLIPGRHLIYFSSQADTISLLPDGTDTNLTPGEPWSHRLWAGGRIQFPQRDGVLGHVVSKYLLGDFVRDVRITGLEGEEKIFVKTERRVTKWASLKKSRAYANWQKAMQRPSEDDTSEAIVVETRDLCFMRPRDPSKPFERRKITPPTDPEFSHSLVPTPALLFRYSALTFNAHAIHIDPEYTRKVYGLPNLVVQGPLCLTLMLEYMRRVLLKTSGEQHTYTPVITEINYRNLAPLFVNEEMTICLKRKRDGKPSETAVPAAAAATNSGTDITKGFTPLPSGEADSVVIAANENSTSGNASSRGESSRSTSLSETEEKYPQEWEVWIQTSKGNEASLAVRGTIKVEEFKHAPQDANSESNESSKVPKSDQQISTVRIVKIKSKDPLRYDPRKEGRASIEDLSSKPEDVVKIESAAKGKLKEPKKQDNGLVDSSGRLTKIGVQALERDTGLLEKPEKMSAIEVRAKQKLQTGTNSSPGVKIVRTSVRSPDSYNTPKISSSPNFLAGGSTTDATRQTDLALAGAAEAEEMARTRTIIRTVRIEPNEKIEVTPNTGHFIRKVASDGPRVMNHPFEKTRDQYSALREVQRSNFDGFSMKNAAAQPKPYLEQTAENEQMVAHRKAGEGSNRGRCPTEIVRPLIRTHLSSKLSKPRISKHPYGKKEGEPHIKKHSYGRKSKPEIVRVPRRLRTSPTNVKKIRRLHISKHSTTRRVRLLYSRVSEWESRNVSKELRVKRVSDRLVKLIARAKALDRRGPMEVSSNVKSPFEGAFERTMRAMLEGG